MQISGTTRVFMVLQIVELPPEKVAKLRERSKPVIEKYTKDVSPEFIAEVNAEIQKVRAKK